MNVTHHRYVTVEGHRIFYREAGEPDAPVFLLLHGAPASSAMFRNLIPLLADEYHLIAPDYVGFGLSDAPSVADFDYTFDNLTRVTEGLLKELRINRFAMYVQDYGAPVGWRLYLNDSSRVTAIVSQNGNAYEDGFVESFWAPLWRYAKDRNAADSEILRRSLDVETIRWQYTHGVSDPSVIDPDSWIRDAAQVNRPGGPEIQLALYADYPSNRRLYDELHERFRAHPVPALAVWGRNDEIFAAAGAHAFTRDLPDAEIQLLDGGHWLLESNLNEAVHIIRQFLNSLPI
jgi:pimeloyl-ACP methyl ester carboxylesterase